MVGATLQQAQGSMTIAHMPVRPLGGKQKNGCRAVNNQLFPNSDSSLKGSSGVFRDPSDVLTGSRQVAAKSTGFTYCCNLRSFCNMTIKNTS